MNNKVALFFRNNEFSWLLAMNLVNQYHLSDLLSFAVNRRKQYVLSLISIFLFLVIFKQSLGKGSAVKLWTFFIV